MTARFNEGPPALMLSDFAAHSFEKGSCLHCLVQPLTWAFFGTSQLLCNAALKEVNSPVNCQNLEFETARPNIQTKNPDIGGQVKSKIKEGSLKS